MYIIDHNFALIRIDSYNSFNSIEKTLAFHNVIILIQSVFNKIKITAAIIDHYKRVCMWKNPIYIFFWINVSILYMLYFERIVIFEGIDFNQTSQSKECDIFPTGIF